MTICLAPRGACGGVLRSRFTCRVFGRASILASPSLERKRMTKMPPDGYPALQYLQSVRVRIFQNRCWVFRPDVEFTGKGGEEPRSGEEGRAPPLECPAVRRPSAGPTWRDCGGIEVQVSPERWGRTMDGSRARRTRDRARRAWYASWRQYRFARHYGFLSGTTTSAAARICSPYAPRAGVLP